MEQNIICKIFPTITDFTKLPKCDQEGLWSITYPKEAEIISNIIKGEIGSNANIFDATAGVGGNTISFAKHFANVTSVEISESRYQLLKNNIEAYKLSNVNVQNADCLDLLGGNYQGYFFDPPWGGPEYKYNFETKIKLGQWTMEEVIYKVKNVNDKPIFIKLPFNYNLSEFNGFNYKIDKIKNYQLITIYQD